MTITALSTILPWITGPVGALVICVAILYGIYRFADNKVWPQIVAWKNRDQDLMQTMVKDNQSALKEISVSIHENTMAIRTLAEQMDYLSDEVKQLKTPTKKG